MTEQIVSSPVKKKRNKEPTWSDVAYLVLEEAGTFLSVGEILDRINERGLKDVASGGRSTTPFARLSSIMATNSRAPHDLFTRCPNRRGHFHLNPDYKPMPRKSQSSTPSAKESSPQDARMHAALAMTEMLPVGPQAEGFSVAGLSTSADATPTDMYADHGADGNSGSESRQPVAQLPTATLSLKKRKITMPSRYEPDLQRGGKPHETTPRKPAATTKPSAEGAEPKSSGKKYRSGRSANSGEVGQLKTPKLSLDMLSAAATSAFIESNQQCASTSAQTHPPPVKRKRGRPPSSPKAPESSSSPKPMPKRVNSPFKRVTTIAALSLDLESPESILKETNLKNILTSTNFRQLPVEYQSHLLNYLPKIDQEAASVSNHAFNNVFVNGACQVWKDQLKDGEFAPDIRSRLKAEYEKRLRIDPWKAKHFERYWGEKRRRHAESHFVLPPSLAAILADLPELPDRDTPPSPVTPKRASSPPRKKKELMAGVDGLKFLAEAAKAADSLPSSANRVRKRRHDADLSETSEWEADLMDVEEEDDVQPPPRRKRGRPPGSSTKIKKEKPPKPEKRGKPGRKPKVPKDDGSIYKSSVSVCDLQGDIKSRSRTSSLSGPGRPKSNISLMTSTHPPAPPLPPRPVRSITDPNAESLSEAISNHPRSLGRFGLDSPSSRSLKVKLMSEDFRSARTEGLLVASKDPVDLRGRPSSMLGKIPPRSKVKHLKSRLSKIPVVPSTEVSSDEDCERFPLKCKGFDHTYARRTEGLNHTSMLYIINTGGSALTDHDYSPTSAVSCPAPVNLHTGHQQLSPAPELAADGSCIKSQLLGHRASVSEDPVTIETFVYPSECNLVATTSSPAAASSGSAAGGGSLAATASKPAQAQHASAVSQTTTAAASPAKTTVPLKTASLAKATSASSAPPTAMTTAMATAIATAAAAPVSGSVSVPVSAQARLPASAPASLALSSALPAQLSPVRSHVGTVASGNTSGSASLAAAAPGGAASAALVVAAAVPPNAQPAPGNSSNGLASISHVMNQMLRASASSISTPMSPASAGSPVLPARMAQPVITPALLAAVSQRQMTPQMAKSLLSAVSGGGVTSVDVSGDTGVLTCGAGTQLAYPSSPAATAARCPHPAMSQPVNQSLNQPLNQAMNRPLSQAMNQPLNQSLPMPLMHPTSVSSPVLAGYPLNTSLPQLALGNLFESPRFNLAINTADILSSVRATAPAVAMSPAGSRSPTIRSARSSVSGAQNNVVVARSPSVSSLDNISMPTLSPPAPSAAAANHLPHPASGVTPFFNPSAILPTTTHSNFPSHNFPGL